MLGYAEAMQPMQPEQAHFLCHGVYIPGLKNEHRVTKGVIGAIPPDKGDYRPDTVSKSAIELAWHIAATEMRFMDAVVAGGFDFTPRPRPDNVKNADDLLAWYTGAFTEHLEKVSKASDEQLLKIVDFRGLFQLPAVMYLGFVTSHTVHHRGQLSMYLRPMGAKVPAIYGESFDSAEAKKAAQKA
jgi:uncharacterized damage-inducible protein DinB